MPVCWSSELNWDTDWTLQVLDLASEIVTKMEMMPQYDLSRMPENTALKQQTLPAHQLDLSASVVLSIFFATGGFCLCMGIILLLSAKSTKEIEINYTNICANCAQLREDSSNFDKECTCSVPFYLPEKMEGDVYMYYKLYGFYQNLYRYILSRSNSQLVGKDIWSESLPKALLIDASSCTQDVKNCSPFQLSQNGTPIIPCGAIANSIFNDTITLSYNLNSSINIEVPMLKSGLTWWTDKYVKFRNPTSSDLASAFAGSAKPPHWAKPIYELDIDDPGNNGFINEDLIVWMRTAAFPTFKKLYRRLNRVHNFVEGLPAGNYSFNISYNFPVTVFQGEKSVVLSTLTWIGGGGLFLGLTYTVTGALTLLASFAILAIYLMLKRNKKSFL
ncbi:cell cycle control protein 50C isoform X1 [Peromyscus maniculatus bairdii]|uniref:cell cycle control protein 50C isoform X1 n=1 Tax=Peromyscus maniculatus bairdii TaxID=230844 RepID=UPI00077DC23A